MQFNQFNYATHDKSKQQQQFNYATHDKSKQQQNSNWPIFYARKDSFIQ